MSEEELIEDAYSFLDKFDSMSESEINRFTDEDVMDALQGYYDKDLVTYPINSIVYRSGIPIEKNKRNFRKQAIHIKYMNNQRAFKVEMGECTNGGRPKKQTIVQQWRASHPEGKKADCIRDTGLTKPTVYKWW